MNPSSSLGMNPADPDIDPLRKCAWHVRMQDPREGGVLMKNTRELIDLVYLCALYVATLTHENLSCPFKM